MAHQYAHLLAALIGREGRYSNNPADSGGETMWGITVANARRYGYHGPMRSMPRSEAERIYVQRYIVGPGFDDVLAISERIGEELVDTGVNMGPAVASLFLQRALNAFNRQGKDYADISEDGDTGPATIRALKALLAKRGKDGETALFRALNAQQGAKYLELSRSRPKDEEFAFGWFLNRVA